MGSEGEYPAGPLDRSLIVYVNTDRAVAGPGTMAPAAADVGKTFGQCAAHGHPQ